MKNDKISDIYFTMDRKKEEEKIDEIDLPDSWSILIINPETVHFLVCSFVYVFHLKIWFCSFHRYSAWKWKIYGHEEKPNHYSEYVWQAARTKNEILAKWSQQNGGKINIHCSNFNIINEITCEPVFRNSNFVTKVCCVYFLFERKKKKYIICVFSSFSR